MQDESNTDKKPFFNHDDRLLKNPDFEINQIDFTEDYRQEEQRLRYEAYWQQVREEQYLQTWKFPRSQFIVPLEQYVRKDEPEKEIDAHVNRYFPELFKCAINHPELFVEYEIKSELWQVEPIIPADEED